MIAGNVADLRGEHTIGSSSRRRSQADKSIMSPFGEDFRIVSDFNLERSVAKVGPSRAKRPLP